MQRDVELFPSEVDLCHGYAALNGNKGIGMSKVGNDLHRAAPKELASLYHPIHMKSVGMASSALSWKEG